MESNKGLLSRKVTLQEVEKALKLSWEAIELALKKESVKG